MARSKDAYLLDLNKLEKLALVVAAQGTLLVHRMRPGKVPDPPAGFLSLFAFACLGSRDVGEARERLCCLPEDTKLTRLLRGEILHGEDFFVPSGEGGYLDSFISAARAYRDFDASVIRSRGRVFLKREIVAKLAESGDFDFRETRLIEALRARTGEGQPVRFGRGRVPVLVLGRIAADGDLCAEVS